MAQGKVNNDNVFFFLYFHFIRVAPVLAPSLTHAWFICVRKQHTLPPSGCGLAVPSSAAACQVHPDVFQLRVPIPQLGALQSVRCGFLATHIRELSAVRGKRR